MLVVFVAFCQLLELMAWLLPNGDSRDLIRGEPKVVELPDLAARYHAQLSQQPTGRPVVVLVAAAGGGIRASYWTSAVLAHADRKAALRDKFLLASGVSGGSLGLALYRALVAVPDLRCRREIGEPSLEACVTEFHSQDMLAGILGARLTAQMLNMLVPKYSRSSVVLERSWEEGWERTFATTISGDKAGAHLFAMSFHDLSRYPGPALVLNTTSVSSGDRAVVSNVRTPWLSTRSCFRNVAELMDLPLSSAANASARFPYLEDWGWIAIRDRKTACAEFEAVADGGFFDNYGAATTLDAYRHLKSLPVETGRPKPQFIVIQISSDPDCRTMRHLEDDGAKVAECESKVARRKKELEPRKVLNPWQSGWAAFGEENTEAMNFNANAWLWNFFYGVPGESGPPGPLGLAMQSRSMTGLDVALRLRDEVRREGDSYYHFSLAGALDVPLGWSLSRHAREQIDALLRDEGANRREMRRLDRELSAAAAPR